MFCRVLVLFLCFLVACGRAPNPPNNTLRISFAIFPTTFDPRKSGDFISATAICLIYEGLTRCLPDGSAEPALAKRIEISSDGTVYTFHLRKSVWSDGEPVTARDFERTWKEILDPKTPSLCAYLFYPIKNAEAAFRQEMPLSEVGIRAIDDWTLEVVLERPTPYFLSLTSFPTFLPISERGDMIQNGPFLIDRIEPQSLIILKKNPTFWNFANIEIDQIQINIIPSEPTAFEMFERGELDWLGGLLSPICFEALASSHIQNKVQYFPMSASTFFTFNTSEGLFSNKNIRRAFSLAIDRREIADEILPTRQILATRCIPPALCGGKDRELFPPYNPALAREYLKKGLEELGQTELDPLSLSFRAGPSDRLIAQVIQRKWKDVLGVDVELEQMDFKTHKDTLHRRQYQVALANWVAQYHDPMNILERFKDSDNAKNYPGWENPEFASLIKAAQSANNDQQRNLLMEKAEELLAEEIPLLPLFHWSNPSLCHPRLRNIHTTPSGGVLFERSYVIDSNKLQKSL